MVAGRVVGLSSSLTIGSRATKWTATDMSGCVMIEAMKGKTEMGGGGRAERTYRRPWRVAMLVDGRYSVLPFVAVLMQTSALLSLEAFHRSFSYGRQQNQPNGTPRRSIGDEMV